MIAIGSWVRDRLERNPAAFRIPSNDLDIFIVRDFLPEKECATLIDLIDVGREPSKLLSSTPDPEFRTSDSCNLNPEEPAVKRVEARITDLIGIDPVQGETIQGQRYDVGQQFKAHYDFFHRGEPYWDDMERTGGQRTWTAMIFLNDVEGGGETFFEKAAVKVTPRRGNLLAWNNMSAIGFPNDFALHQGMPVAAGLKYIITKWYRERAWGWGETQPY